MTTQASVNIPKDVIEPIVEAQIKAAIVAQLGDPGRLIEQVIEKALSQKVGENGEVDKYGGNRYSLIEAVSKKAINKIVREAIEEFIERQRSDIQKRVVAQLDRRKETFAKALVDGFVTASKQSWRIDCKFELKDRE